MKQDLSSLDIKYLADELQYLKGARLQKFYQVDRFIIISLHASGKGTQNLVLGDGMFHATKYPVKKPEKPTNFAMVLRKYLKGARIEAIYQHEFERILIIDTGEYFIIAELFSKGNIIFATKKDLRIWSVLERQLFSETRKLKMHGTYSFPPASYNIKDMKKDDFEKKVLASEKQIVALLAREFSFGGVYAEEVLKIAGIDKKTTSKKISKKEIAKLYDSATALLNKKLTPEIVLEDEKPITATPFNVCAYEKNKKRKYTSFNDAIDDFFTKNLVLDAEKKENKTTDKKRDSFAVRIDTQKKAIKELEKKSEEFKALGDFIYSNYSALDTVLNKINAAGFGRAKKIPGVVSLDPKQKTVTLDTKPRITLKIGLSLNDNANLFYTKSKKTKEKMKGASEALLDSEKKLVLFDGEKAKKEAKAASPLRKEKKEWYDKFLWFFSSEGFLCIAGRDAATNETIVKKHTGNKDIIFHADITGSPFGVVKTEGKEVGRGTHEEMAQFISAHSRAWRAGIGSLEAYWVLPDQVTKKTKAGEYMGKGSFMVYGKKNIIKTELRLAVGFDKDHIVVGPVDAVLSKTKKAIIIVPGGIPAGDLARKIKISLLTQLNKQEQEILKKTSIDAIQRHIPYGKGEISG